MMKTNEAIEAFLENCKQRNLSPETIRWYEVFLRVLNNKHKDLPVTTEAIEQLIAGYPGQYRRMGCFRALKTFFIWSSSRFDFPNPYKKGDHILIHAPQIKKNEKASITLDQITRLLEYPHPKATKALLYFLTDTGARIGEASSLKRENIFEDSVKIVGKTGSRQVPLSPKTRDLLLALGPHDFRTCPSKERKQDCVFPISTERMMVWVCNAFKDINLPGYHAHLLRHAFATLWNGDLMTLKQITGHASYETLEIYRHRRLEVTKLQHLQNSPLAQIHQNGVQEKATRDKSAETSPGPMGGRDGDHVKVIKDIPVNGNHILIQVSAPAALAAGKGITVHISSGEVLA